MHGTNDNRNPFVGDEGGESTFDQRFPPAEAIGAPNLQMAQVSQTGYVPPPPPLPPKPFGNAPQQYGPPSPGWPPTQAPGWAPFASPNSSPFGQQSPGAVTYPFTALVMNSSGVNPNPTTFLPPAAPFTRNYQQLDGPSLFASPPPYGAEFEPIPQQTSEATPIRIVENPSVATETGEERMRRLAQDTFERSNGQRFNTPGSQSRQQSTDSAPDPAARAPDDGARFRTGSLDIRRRSQVDEDRELARMIAQQEVTDAAMAKVPAKYSYSDNDTEMRDASGDERNSPFADRSTRPESPNFPGGFKNVRTPMSTQIVISGRPAWSTSSPSVSGKPRAIYFYESTKPHYGFTNFSSHTVKFQGKVYPTSEHLFQALKFLEHRPNLAEHIRTAGNGPRTAFNEAHRFAPEVRPDWKEVSIPMMETVIYNKFNQHADLRRELLMTGEAELVENAGANDAFWGNGADGKGRNELGKVLMRLRAHLRSGPQPR